MSPFASDPAPRADAEPVTGPARSRWPTWLGMALTVGMVAGLAYELLGQGLAGLTAAVPTHPLFYVSFALFYMALPVGDYLIFRRLWGIPLSGLVALTKKRIANDVIVSYTGEAYFYAWVRERARFVTAPFGAIKDVSILSAIAGNAVTLLMLAVALPLGRELLTAAQYETALWSTAALIGISAPFLIFSRRVFSLPRRELWAVFGLHSGRVIASSTFTGLAWHFALPEVSIGTWLLLAAARLLISRLPLLSSLQKEGAFLVFANLLIGERDAVTQLIAFFTALTFATNGVMLLIFGLWTSVTKRSAR